MLVGGEDTGEPFFILTLNSEGQNVCVVAPADEAVTSFAFSVKAEISMPIPEQYLTNAMPYYIDITGSGTDDDPYVCNRTVAEVNAMFDSGRAMAVRTAKDNVGATPPYTNIFIMPLGNVMLIEGKRVFTFCTANANDYFIMVPKDDGTFGVADSW
jgi:hypothetical protein